MARRQGNFPDRALLDELTDALRYAVIDGAEAIKDIEDFRRRSFDKWMTVARGVAPLCELADRPGTSRKARKNLLADNGYGTLNESTISRLLLMAKHETAIRIWRDSPTMTQHKRDTWNSPTSICNRCPAVRAAIAEANKNRPLRQRGKGKPQANPTAALETHLDKLLDLIAAVEDIDNRRVLVERVRSSVVSLLPQDESAYQPAKKAVAKSETFGQRKLLTWKVVSKDRDGREGFRAKTPKGRGYYSVDAAWSDNVNFYVATHHLGPKERTVSPQLLSARLTILTPEDAMAFAERDWEQGNVDERTRKEQQPTRITIRL
jgi:hypothetical protein